MQIKHKNFIPRETALIFDEFQDNLDIATTLKTFREDGRFDVILSGSLLGISYKKINSNSVGNKLDYEMHSMDFEEFLRAKGYRSEQIINILEHMIDLKPFTETEYSIWKNLWFCCNRVLITTLLQYRFR